MSTNMVHTSYLDLMVHSPSIGLPMTPNTPGSASMTTGTYYATFDDLPTATPTHQVFLQNNDDIEQPMSGVLPHEAYPAGIDHPTGGIPTHLIPGLTLIRDENSQNNNVMPLTEDDAMDDIKTYSKTSGGNKKITKKMGSKVRKHSNKKLGMNKDGSERNDKSAFILQHSAESRRTTKLALRRKKDVKKASMLLIDVGKANAIAPTTTTTTNDNNIAIEMHKNERVGPHNIIPSDGTGGRPSRAAKARVEEQRRERRAQAARQEVQRRSLVKYNLRGASKKNDNEEFERRRMAEKARKDLGGGAGVVEPAAMVGGCEPPSPLCVNGRLPGALMDCFGNMGI